MLSSPYVSWDDVAGEHAADLVLASLGPGPALGEAGPFAVYAAGRPGLQVAVLQGGRVLPGSSPVLAAALAALGPALPVDGRLAVPLGDGGMAAFRQSETAYGPVVVVTAGAKFRLSEDLGTFFARYALQLVPMFGPALLAGCIAMPLLIRRILRPVRAAAAAAEAIDFRSLDRRLDALAAPTELRPLLGAFNGLLARVEDGAQRQRLFTANAAHELRTPVAILQARVDSLPEAAPERAALARDLRRMTLLLDQLLAVARLGQAETLQEATPIDLAALARRVVGDMAPLAIRSGRSLALEAGTAVSVRGHAQALESALGNLVENALRAEPPGGTVVVVVGPGARLAVVDHGPGVAEAERSFLFEPFWRREDGSRGTGLGLAMVREVARLHGGTAEVCETAGGGATFTLRLQPMPNRAQSDSRSARDGTPEPAPGPPS
jgi:signal transduction histidine kinase